MKDESQVASVDTRKYRSTLQITFAYDGERVRLARIERLQGIAPGSPPPAPKVGENSGSWVELRDAQDRLLFYRVLHNPVRYMVEEHLPDGRIRAVPGPAEAGTFDVLLPDIPEAASVALFSSPFDMERSGEPAEEIGRFPLRETDPGKEGQR